MRLRNASASFELVRKWNHRPSSELRASIVLVYCRAQVSRSVAVPHTISCKTASALFNIAAPLVFLRFAYLGHGKLALGIILLPNEVAVRYLGVAH